jgi:predicted transcriptional regulator
MDFIRTVTNSNILINIIDIPNKLKNRLVEILILPVETDRIKNELPAKNKKMRGALKKYRNAALIKQEKKAWQKAVGDKHESR